MERVVSSQILWETTAFSTCLCLRCSSAGWLDLTRPLNFSTWKILACVTASGDRTAQSLHRNWIWKALLLILYCVSVLRRSQALQNDVGETALSVLVISLQEAGRAGSLETILSLGLCCCAGDPVSGDPSRVQDYLAKHPPSSFVVVAAAAVFLCGNTAFIFYFLP